MPKTKIPAEYISDNPSLSGTDSVKVPAGTTAQRGTGVAGKFRFNTTLNKFEGYTDSWGEIGGSGGSALETDNFTGDDSTTAFTLSSSVSDEDNLIVFIDGVYQNKADYVASGTTLTLDTAPLVGRKIVVYHVRANVSGSNCILNSFSGNGSTTAFTLTQNPASENNTQVFIDGVYQRKDSYSVSGTTLTFDAAPANGTAIEVMMFTQTDINTLPASFVSGLTEVTAVGADHMMIFDATDSALKKALVSDVIEGTTGISSSADATAITIDSSERVGIGVTSMSNKLVVGGTEAADTTYLRLQNTPATAATHKVAMEFWGNEGTANGSTFNMGRIYGEFDGSNYSDSRLTLGSASGGGTFNDELNIKNGNVGIGTSSPSQKLSVTSADNTSSTNIARFAANNDTLAIGIGYETIRQTESAGVIKFETGGSERMKINSSGQVSIGTISPAAPFHVKGASGSVTGVIYAQQDTTGLGKPGIGLSKYDNNTTTSQVFMMFGIDQYNAGCGQINANGTSQAAFGSFSDRRLKENITDLPSQLDNIVALQPKEFDYIESEGGGHQIGFIAQEVEEIYPDLVGERDSDNMKTLSGMGKMEARLISAIKELKADNDALRARIETLENA